MENADVTLVGSFEEAEEFIRWCDEPHPYLAVDTETTDVTWKARMRTFQIGDEHNAYVIPFERGGWGGLVRDGLSRLRGTTFVMHNFAFDQAILMHDGLELPDHRVVDTRIMAHLLDPGKPTGLKPLADRLLVGSASHGQKLLNEKMKKNGWTWATVPVDVPEFWFYGGLDTILTARLRGLLEPQIAPYQRVYDLEYACQVVLKKMRYRGVLCDMDYVDKKLEELRYEIDHLRSVAEEEYGVKNLTSNDQVADKLIEMGWEPPEYTATGKPKMSKDILAGMALHYPLAELCRQAKHLEKMASSQYLGGYEDLVDEHGFIHPNINPLGARTARMSVREPALQTLHRDAVVRDAFIPRRGHKMVFIDYDQQEVRFAAHYSADPRYIQVIMESDDIHRTSAALIYGVPEDAVDKKMRAITKNAIYSILYGAGVDKFSKTAGLKVEEGKEFYDAFYRAFPGVRQMQLRVQDTAARRYDSEGLAYVHSHIGRRHLLNEWEVDGVEIPTEDGELAKLFGEGYKLVNYLIQGSGADEIKRAIVDLDRAGVADHMVLVVHDEIGFDVPEKEVEEVANVAVQCMENHRDYLVPLTCAANIVDRWGDKYRG